jgi:hypothetical protein
MFLAELRVGYVLLRFSLKHLEVEL